MSGLSTLALACALTPLARGDEPQRPVVRAVKIEGEGPVIDGRADDPIWERAIAATSFVQQQPDEGKDATEKTEVRVLYDQRALYIAIVCFDSEPDKIVVTQGRRDADLTNTDSVQIILDTFDDDQNAFLFGTTPLGIEHDGQIAAEGNAGGVLTTTSLTGGFGAGGAQRGALLGFNKNWDGDWKVRSRVTERGWETELEIPLKTLRYNGGSDRRWGFNVMRNIRRKNEQDFLAPVPRAYNIYRVSMAGELVGLDLPRRKDLRAVPYALAGFGQDNTRTTDRTDALHDAGLDVKWGITPKLTADFTVNTDFAQVEADEEQVNLSRFDLFFPEKRGFFLENAAMFQFGQPQQVDLFFSRRIGLSRAGELIDIVGGARLSGKVGHTNVGFMDMQTEAAHDKRTGRLIAPGNNFGVMRVQREFARRSNVGAIFVNRQGTGEFAGQSDFNRAYGVDLNLAAGKNTRVFAFLARSESPGAIGSDTSGRLYTDFRSNVWEIRGGYTQVGERFNAEGGFVPRVGYKKPEIFVQFGPEPRSEGLRWIRKFTPHVRLEEFYGFDNELQSRFWHFHPELQQMNGGRFGVQINNNADRPLVPFRIFAGRNGKTVIIPPGLYKWWEWAPSLATDPSRPVWVSTMFTKGDFYDGRRTQYNVDLGLQSKGRFQGGIGYIRNEVDLPHGAFDTDLVRLKATYSFTPRLSLQALVQYNSQTAQASSNIRFSWFARSGTGLFLVYNDERDTFGDGQRSLGRALIVKYTRQFDF